MIVRRIAHIANAHWPIRPFKFAAEIHDGASGRLKFCQDDTQRMKLASWLSQYEPPRNRLGGHRFNQLRNRTDRGQWAL